MTMSDPRDDGIVVLSPRELPIGSNVVEVIDELAATGIRELILDLTEVEFFEARHLGHLAALVKAANWGRLHTSFVLTGASLKRLLTTISIDRYIEFYKRVEDARTAARQRLVGVALARG